MKKIDKTQPGFDLYVRVKSSRGFPFDSLEHLKMEELYIDRSSSPCELLPV